MQYMKFDKVFMFHKYFTEQLINSHAKKNKNMFNHSVGEVTILIKAFPMLETEYSSLFDQYHACWCPGSLSRQDISRHGVDSIGYATCTKCEYVFYDIQNNSAC